MTELNIKGKIIKALWIEKASHLKLALDNSLAATGADDNGAFNIWEDESGKIVCEGHRFCKIVDYQTFTTYKEAKKWLKETLQSIK